MAKRKYARMNEEVKFSGLTDKNGIDIYEGDKIKYKDYNGYSKIVFKNGSFGYYGISCYIILLEANVNYITVIQYSK